MNNLESLKEATKGADLEGFLRFFLDKYGKKLALASSMGAEDQVLTDVLCKINPEIRIFTLKTGRLPEETHDLIAKTNTTYGINIECLEPDTEKVDAMVAEHGADLFYESVDKRKLCCRIRKTEPLSATLKTLDAWITGLRQSQSVSRTTVERIECDEATGLIKLNPLAEWSEKDIWDYIKKHNVPYNQLHDKGYPSIGCAPCTRAIKSGEDIRAGRWWWESPESKECGIHIKDGKISRTKDEK